MSLLPVASRELRVVARRPRTYRSRDLSALLVTLVSLGMLYAGFAGRFTAASAGQNLFLAISLLAGVYVLLEGTILTADCLSQEKREGTLGLLFLTDLHGYDIVAGKLVSQAANTAYSLLAAIPPLGIVLFLGGVTGQDFLRMAAALINALFFSAAFGLLVSASCRAEQRALSLAVFGVLLWTGLLPLLGWGMSLWLQEPNIRQVFLVTSPAGAFLFALQAGVVVTGSTFAQSILYSHLLGWVFLAAASWLLSISSGRQPSERRSGTGWLAHRRNPGRPAALPTDEIACTPRAPVSHLELASENPVFAVGAGRAHRGAGMWPILAIFIVAWAIGWSLGRGQLLTLPVYIGSMIALHLSLAFMVVLQACKTPGEDQRSGVLELLLTTPIGDDAYLRGRLLLLKRNCFWAVLAVIAADAGFMLAGCWAIRTPSWEWLGWLGAFVVMVSRLLVDLYTLSWVGVWQGLAAARTPIALRRTLFYVLGWRWIVLLGLMGLLGVVTAGKVYQSPAGAIIAAIGYLAQPLFSLPFFCRAMSELQDDLRALALDNA